MKKLLMILMFMTVNTSLFSQVRFQHIIGGNGYDDAQDMLQTGDGGFLMCGTTESFGAGQSDILLIKTDGDGIVQWSKAYGSPGLENGVAIKKDPSGGYIMAGTTYGLSNDTLTDDFLLIKINGTGMVQWAKTYGGTANDEAHALTVMPDSGFVIAGTTSSFGSVTNQAGYVVRTDKNGNQLWAKAITQNSDQQLFSVAATTDGGCIVAGYTYVSTFRLFDIFLARLNANGTKQWVRSYGGSNSEQAFSVQEAATGGFVVSGYTSSFGTGQDDAFILRTSENGSVNWFSTYGSVESERARSISWHPTEGIFVSGQAKVSSPGGLIDHNFLIRADTGGVVTWSKTYGPTQNISLAYSSVRCSDGGFAMTGITGGFGAVLNDVYLVKTNDVGGSGCHQANLLLFSSNFTPSDSSGGAFSNGGVEDTVTAIRTNVQVNTIIQCNSTGVGVEENGIETEVKVYPNPASGTSWLEISTGVAPGTVIRIFTAEGQELARREITEYTNKIALHSENFQNGMYIVSISGQTNTVYRKLIIQR